MKFKINDYLSPFELGPDDPGADNRASAPGQATASTSSGSAGAVISPETVTYSGSGLVFVNTYGSGVTTTFRNEIVAAENYFQSHFTNSCTINCSFDLQALNHAYSGENSFSPITVSYSSLVSALRSHATTPDDLAAVNALSHLSDPSGGVGFEVPIGEARILGLAGAGSGIDDAVVLNNFYWTASALQNSPNDAIAVIEHEISEGAMGRIGSLGTDGGFWAPMDLFRFTASGQRDLTGGRDGVATYFSTDGSSVATGLQYHNSISSSGANDGFDLSDWDQVGSDANARDPFGPGGPGVGDPGVLSATDLRIMDVLGWTPTPTAPTTLTAHDLNGDGVSDITLYDTSSTTVGEWLMQAGHLTQAKSIAALGAGSGWTLAGSGDFNGDHTADLLLYNTNSGAAGEWLMQNGQLSAAQTVAPDIGTGWNIAGTGDFNGDGTTDVLLYFAGNGTVGEWLMQNGQISTAQTIAPSAGSGWAIAGTGDLNGDGTTDILLYNQTNGAVGEWLMQNGHLATAQTVGFLSAGWSIASTGDFNGDHTSDILLYNSNSGAVGEWLMQGGHIALTQTIASLPAGSTVAGTGDFNGDGTTDILFQNSATGSVGQWAMQNGQVSQSTTIASNGAGSTWHVAQV